MNSIHPLAGVNRRITRSVICETCGTPFKTTQRNRAINCPACRPAHRAKYNKHRRLEAGHKPLGPRPCVHCGELFTPKSVQANLRQACYKQECIDKSPGLKHKEKYKGKPKVKENTWPYFCNFCGKRLEPPYKYYHDACFHVSEHRLDGNYIYCDSGEGWDGIPKSA
jgi:DNA-directed RNA polymerase subunit RPC12/RpoP